MMDAHLLHRLADVRGLCSSSAACGTYGNPVGRTGELLRWLQFDWIERERKNKSVRMCVAKRAPAAEAELRWQAVQGARGTAPRRWWTYGCSRCLPLRCL